MAGLLIFLGIFLVIFAIAIIGIQIWGIVVAAQTKDKELRVGRLLLHLFLFGGVVAAIIYAVQVKK